MSIFEPPALGISHVELATRILPYCYLPHPEVVSAFAGNAVFPTIRARPRGYVNERDGVLYDSNKSPKWAILWAHGIGRRLGQGWMLAHVWPTPHDPNSYTNLANLAIIPECYGTLTDKEGPLAPYLRYHAVSRYGWKPDGASAPKTPDGYSDIPFSYLGRHNNPTGFVRSRLIALNNQRVQKLRALMGIVVDV